MRISVMKTDPGYIPDAHKHLAFLDGNPLFNCFTADEEQGTAWVHKTDEEKNVLVNKPGTGIITELLKGRVQIIKAEG